VSEESEEEGLDDDVAEEHVVVRAFHRCVVPQPPADEVKRYKAYLTRLSKWAAVKRANKQRQVNVSALRGFLISEGELGSYLDDGWAKRVFSDADLFSDVGDGFWQVSDLSPDEAQAKPSKWEGVRPGDDVLGDVLFRIHAEVVRHRVDLDLGHPLLDSDQWAPLHQIFMRYMKWAKSARGLEKPLNDLQDRAFREACLDADANVQLVSVWLTNTRLLIDVMTRLLATVKDGVPYVHQFEVDRYAPAHFAVTVSDDVVTPTHVLPTYEMCLMNVRRLLLNRGILDAKKR